MKAETERTKFMQLRLLSIDPGFVNMGWAIVVFREPDVVSVSKYGVFRFSDPNPTASEVQSGLESFCKEVMKKYLVLFDAVLIEAQPYVKRENQGNPDKGLMNFRLQQIDMGLRGLVLGMGLDVITTETRAVRVHLGISTGDYNENKRASVKFCLDIALQFKELPPHQRCHVADAVCNCIYHFSKKLKLFKINDFRQSLHLNGPECKKFKKCYALPRSITPPSSPEGIRCGSSQEDDSSDQ